MLSNNPTVPVAVRPQHSSLENWGTNVKSSLGKPITNVNGGKKLPGTGEEAIARYLGPLKETLTNLVTDAKDKLSNMPVTDDAYYQKQLVKMALRGDKRTDKEPKEGLYVAEEKAIDKWIATTLKDFDNDTGGFKKNFTASLGEPAITPEDARKTLNERLQNEKKRVDEQKTFEEALIKSVREFISQNARARSLKEFNALALAGKQPLIEEVGQTLPQQMTFTPGNKQFSFLSALGGVVHGSVYTINDKGDHTEHNFNPKDPDACKALVAYARANNASEVTLTLGGGTKDDYQQFGQLNPANNRRLRDIARWFVANSQGFNDVVPKKWTGESLMEDFKKNGKLPSIFTKQDHDGKPLIDLDIKPFKLKFTNCSLPELDTAEPERYKGIRKVLKQCGVIEIEKKLEENEKQIKEYKAKGANLTPAESEEYKQLFDKRITLSAQLDKDKAKQEQTHVPSPKPN